MESMTDLNNLATFLTTIGTVFTALVGIVASVTALVKPIRRKLSTLIMKSVRDADTISSKFDAFETKLQDIQNTVNTVKTDVQQLRTENQTQNASIELIKHANIDEMKHTLTEMYYKAKHDNGISRYNRTNFVSMFETYSKLGGNSYVHELYEQILNMPILDD